MTFCGSANFHLWFPALHMGTQAQRRTEILSVLTLCWNIIKMVLCLWVRPTVTTTTGCGVLYLVIVTQRKYTCGIMAGSVVASQLQSSGQCLSGGLHLPVTMWVSSGLSGFLTPPKSMWLATSCPVFPERLQIHGDPEQCFLKINE